MLPHSIALLRETSVRSRNRLIKKYGCIRARPVMPPYIESGDIIASHIARSEFDMARKHKRPDMVCNYRAYTRAATEGYRFRTEAGALSEVCLGVMGGVLSARGRLHVAAGFFSIMVACIDDCLDKEGSFNELGERLFCISHAYRDLMDIALDEEVRYGRLTSAELYEIRLRLFDVIKTLAGSERTHEAEQYLYEKSCGDKVIGVIFPASSSSGTTKKRCAEIGRLAGEAGQLIDDIMDYENDREKGKRNYIAATGGGVGKAIEGAGQRIKKAKELASGIDDGGEVRWILDALAELTGILGDRHLANGRIDPGVLGLSTSLKELLPKGVPANQFLIWF